MAPLGSENLVSLQETQAFPCHSSVHASRTLRPLPSWPQHGRTPVPAPSMLWSCFPPGLEHTATRGTTAEAVSSPATCHLLMAPKRTRQILVTLLGQNPPPKLGPSTIPKGHGVSHTGGSPARLPCCPPVTVSLSLPQTREDKTLTDPQTPGEGTFRSARATVQKLLQVGKAVGASSGRPTPRRPRHLALLERRVWLKISSPGPPLLKGLITPYVKCECVSVRLAEADRN